MMLDRVRQESERKGMNLNVKKTQCMVISKRLPVPKLNLRCGNQTVKQVARFMYLGSLITEDATCKKIDIERKTCHFTPKVCTT